MLFSQFQLHLNNHIEIANENGKPKDIDKYKADNKKLRRDLHSLKAKHEEMALLMQQSIAENEQLIRDKSQLEQKLIDLEKFGKTIGSGAELASNDQFTEHCVADETNEINILHKKIDRLQKEWDKERASLREEVRRLNMENSQYRNLQAAASHDKSVDEEEEEWTKRYNISSSQSKDRADSFTEMDDEINRSNSLTSDAHVSNLGQKNSSTSDSSDISCLQSIIATLSQTIHQTTTEKELLQQQLEEEQTRSHQELQAFAKTLEGVDDLRKSAERMSRELRRIKIKGHKPTRSDLIHGSNEASTEFAAANKANSEMEDAIRVIESQNEAMNERWSASQKNVGDIKVFTSKPEHIISKHSSISSDGSAQGDGFTSYWHTRDKDDSDKKRDKGAKEKRKKKKKSSGGSVFTSFF